MRRQVICLILLVSLAWGSSSSREGLSYVHVGEGWTSGSIREPSQVAYRLFSAPDQFNLAPAAKLVVEPNPIVLVPGHGRHLSDLRIFAFDPNGAFLPLIPITLEIDQRTAEALETGPLYKESRLLIWRPAAPGLLRVRALFGSSSVLVPVMVIPSQAAIDSIR